MKTRMRRKEFKLLGCTPPGFLDPAIAISTSRAGGLGILNLEYAEDERAAMAAISKLAKYAVNECGIKIDGMAEKLFAGLIPQLPDKIKTVILTAAGSERLQAQVRALRKEGLLVLLEAIDSDQARAGEAAGVDGLIAKGNEAAGWIAEETTLILLQRLLAHSSLPVFAQGGIGLHTVAACFAAGADGVVLDSQLLLSRESSLPDATKLHIARMDGSETICLGTNLGGAFRAYGRTGMSVIEELQEVARSLEGSGSSSAEIRNIWRQEIEARVGWERPDHQILPLGQDAAFAAPLAKQFRTAGGIICGFREAVEEHLRAAKRFRPLDQGAPLARSHNTAYPIVQGPMTRVSDTAAFACEVANNGALPLLALALMRADEVRALLEESQKLLGNRPWGVGILGFVPLELREEQLEVILAYRPPFALIAGGRPDQALMLDRAGIPTYLHVPSPGLLKIFIENGARRFVLEGRECGGHVGPRSSFVLWNLMVDVLLQSLPADEVASCHVLFAGGIHDAVSSSMVATVAAPLAERGAKVGALLGTAYLFTREAVTSGAIVENFQREALDCAGTVLLESGPGHATRCARTPFVEAFEREKRRLSADNKSSGEMREALEHLNVGRLRVASKALDRNPGYGQDPKAPKFVRLDEEQQHVQGMYMIGQLAALRDSTCTIEELHQEISIKGSARLAELSEQVFDAGSLSRDQKPCDVAIIGMGCMMPKAPSLEKYWENILHKVDAITEVPEHRWDWRRYYDRDPEARDKVNSKWGGFLEEVPFDPLRYGIPPNSIPSIEPAQLLTLEVVYAAFEDAGYLDRPFARRRTSVIFGMGGGAADLSQKYGLRAGLPGLIEEERPDLLSQLPEWTSDSFAGTLMSVAAGRIANRLDLGGVNYTVDAACASSLAALDIATRELESGTSDMVVVGGVDTDQCPLAYLGFSKTQTLSGQGRCRTFDESADGIVISEGVAAIVLKRLADAERDGDRIYAVIKAVAGSSDGRDKSLTAPRPEGQAMALERAYAKAGVSPASVTLIEAHGTGTPAGDLAETETLKRVLEAAGARRQSCAIGSVKSMIGHTKRAAGAAGLIKVAKALYHKVLPPTIHVEKPNSKIRFSESSLYVNTEARPWMGLSPGEPRRAGLSAFGFGGTNFHAVLEEYEGDFMHSHSEAASNDWPAELFLWAAGSRDQLLKSIESVEQSLAGEVSPRLRDVAHTLWKLTKEESGPKLAIVASSIEDLRQKLGLVREALEQPKPESIKDHKGIYLSAQPLGKNGKLAFLFPGQGSQYPGMLSDLAMHFSEVREHFELADRVLDGKFSRVLSSYIFPPPAFSPDEHRAHEQKLTETHIAQPALGASGIALTHLYQKLGINPQMAAGHSYGEYTALCSAGVLTEEALYLLSEARGRAINESSEKEAGTMAAVMEGDEKVNEVLEGIDGVWVANFNAPRQTVISGTREGVSRAVERFMSEGIQARPIPVARAFHTPIVAEAQHRLTQVLATVALKAPQFQVFSNAMAAPYTNDPDEIGDLLAEHLISPVRFSDEIQQMYASGARIFVEVGPRSVLTGLTDQILDDQPHLALASDIGSRPGMVQLLHVLGQLAAHGVDVNLDHLFDRRCMSQLKLDRPEAELKKRESSRSIWLVDGGRARPAWEADSMLEAVSEEAHVRTPAETVRNSVMHQSSEKDKRAVAQPSSSLEQRRKQVDVGVPLKSSSISPGNGSSSDSLNHPLQSGDVGQVMAGFQRLMNRFLETQQSVMLAYLRGTNGKPEHNAEHATLERVDEIEPPQAPSSAVYGLPEPAVVAPPNDRVADTGTSGLVDSVIKPASAREPQVLDERASLANTLIEIVSERTGYPTDMLDLDINLEADLGIDSIKHVEIIGVLQQSFSPGYRQEIQERMEMLVRTKTLRGILDLLKPSVEVDQAQKKKAQPTALKRETPAERTGIEADRTVEIPRSILKRVESRSGSQADSVRTDGVLLITDDERGVARALAEMLESRHGRPVLVRRGNSVSRLPGRLYTADLTDPQNTVDLLDLIRQEEGCIATLIHLLPLSEGVEFENMNLADWQDRAHLEVKSLFHLARAVSKDLKAGNKSQAGRLLAATLLGTPLGESGTSRPAFSPVSAGVAGLTKTLALEWPDVICRVAHLDFNESIEGLVRHLMEEITTDGREREVVYQSGSRYILQSEKRPLEPSESSNLMIDADSVLLITGGARGITAAAAIDLARQYHPRLILIGRSPLPPAIEPSETAELMAPKEIKAALIEQIRSTQDSVTPAQVEACYARLMRDREIRKNLVAIQQAGARIEYQQVDVRDGLAFERVIKDIYRAYGRLDGVIHGAGIIEDKLIEDKTPDSFDRVFDTKATGAFILARNLRPETRFLVFFSSVAGSFGNRGQSDYAAANEVLNKLAVYLNSKWQGRVVSINWGPWEGVGMVSEEVRQQFAMRGVQTITPEAGQRALDRELRFGRKGDVEVVLGSEPAEVSENWSAASVNLGTFS